MSELEQCKICGKDLSSDRVESYTLVHWKPNKRKSRAHNVLVAMYCPEHTPLVDDDFLVCPVHGRTDCGWTKELEDQVPTKTPRADSLINSLLTGGIPKIKLSPESYDDVESLPESPESSPDPSQPSRTRTYRRYPYDGL